MTLILWDIEYTAWQGSQQRNWSTPGEHRELVQVVAIKIKDNKIIDKCNIFIKPTQNPELSDYFTKLTGITNEMITNKGVSFKEFLKLFYQFTHNKKGAIPCYSYGNDYDILKENFILNGINNNEEWEKSFHDIKPLFRISGINVDKYTCGTVYRHFYPKDERESVHDAMWDVYSLFLTLSKL